MSVLTENYSNQHQHRDVPVSPTFQKPFDEDQFYDEILNELVTLNSLPTDYLVPSTLVIATPWTDFGKSGSPRSFTSSPISSACSSTSPKRLAPAKPSKNSRKRSLETQESVSPISSNEDEGSVSAQSSTVVSLNHHKNNASLIPRIVKSDIRRKISFMFANVMNSYDYTLIDSFFRKFCIPSVELEKVSTPMAGCNIHVPGMDLVVSYFGALLTLSPDNVIRVGETKIKQSIYSDGCELISNFSLRFTKFYQAPPALLAEYIKKQHSLRISNNTDPADESFKRSMKRAKKFEVNSYSSYEATKQEIAEDNDYQNFFHQFDPHNVKSSITVEQFQKIENPVPFGIDGQVTFRINDQKRVTSIKMVASMFYQDNKPLTMCA